MIYQFMECNILYIFSNFKWVRSNLFSTTIKIRAFGLKLSFSGPNLVSRAGDSGWTEKHVKETKWSLIKDTTKGVAKYWQLDGGHGSWNPIISV
jgi:hypothetical protein